VKVSDIMTHSVLTVTPETSVGEVAELMIGHRISGLPVVNPAGDVIGIVTEGDLLRRAETGTERRRARWLEFLIAPGDKKTVTIDLKPMVTSVGVAVLYRDIDHAKWRATGAVAANGPSNHSATIGRLALTLK